MIGVGFTLTLADGISGSFTGVQGVTSFYDDNGSAEKVTAGKTGSGSIFYLIWSKDVEFTLTLTGTVGSGAIATITSFPADLTSSLTKNIVTESVYALAATDDGYDFCSANDTPVINGDGSVILAATPFTTHSVNITLGSNMTSRGGDLSQTGLSSAMIDVVVAPDSGYTLTAPTITGSEVTATPNADGTYTISGMPTSDVTITFADAEANVVSPTYTASFGTPSDNPIEPNPDLSFTVPVIITSESKLSAAELDLRCNPEVAKITGVTLAEGLKANGNHNQAADGSSAKISFFGDPKDAKDGLTVATVSMQPMAVGTSSLKIESDGWVAMSGSTRQYDLSVYGSPVEVKVEKQDEISSCTYVQLGTSGVITLLTYTPGTPLSEGEIPTYKGNPMFSLGNGSYVYMVIGEVDKTQIAKTTGTVTTIKHPKKDETDGLPADLNGSNTVNIVDAQIAYDLATGVYTQIGAELTDNTVDMLHWLMADVNGDNILNADDPRGIQAFIHSGVWFKNDSAAA